MSQAKRVLLTGASGFIGRHALAPLVARGYEVHAVSARGLHAPTPGVHWHSCDLLAAGPALVADVRPSHWLHLAWYAEHGKFWRAPENLEWVRATLAMAEAFAAHGGARFVGAGTCAEYDWAHGYCTEGLTPLAPATLYGAAKHATWTVLAPYFAQSGVSAAWGRVFFVYGPHEAPARLVASVTRELLAGREAHCSEGLQVRDFMHVQDVADAFAALLDSPVEGALNVASGRPVAVRALVETLATQLGRPTGVAFGALPAPAGDPPLLAARTERLAHELGFTPRFNLASGLADTISWWRRQLATEET